MNAKEHLKNFPMDHLTNDIKELVYAAWENGYVHGTADALEAELAAERAIPELNKRFDNIDNDLTVKTLKHLGL